MANQSTPRLTRRRLWIAINNQPPNPHNDRQFGQRDTHGGFLDIALCHWMITHPRLLNINSHEMRCHTFIEMGHGPGNWSQVASSCSPHGNNVIAIDREEWRCNRLRDWNTNLCKAGLTQQYLPTVRCGDFTSNNIKCLNNAIKCRKVVVYLNNFNSFFVEGGVQHKIEDKLAQCKVCSIVITLDQSFLDDLSWQEEVFSTNLPRGHVSWRSNNNNHDAPVKDVRKPIPTLLYKYSKIAGERIAGRRSRVTKTNNLVYPYLRRRFGLEGR